jgi:hypothetical protein
MFGRARLFLQDQHVYAVSGQSQRQTQADRSGPDYDYITLCHLSAYGI